MVDSLIFGLAWSGPMCYVTNLVVTSFYIIGPAQPKQARLQIRTCPKSRIDENIYNVMRQLVESNFVFFFFFFFFFCFFFLLE